MAIEVEHAAQMISYRILSEVEKMCDKRKLSKKELTKAVGTSPSYITQLFRGNKILNMEMMAKFEIALSCRFEIKAAKPFRFYFDQSLTPNT